MENNNINNQEENMENNNINNQGANMENNNNQGSNKGCLIAIIVVIIICNPIGFLAGLYAIVEFMPWLIKIGIFGLIAYILYKILKK